MRTVLALIILACVLAMAWRIFKGVYQPAVTAAGPVSASTGGRNGRAKRVLENLDKRVNSKIAGFLCVVIAASTVGGSVGYEFYSSGERALEFLSYMFPCLAGIVAGYAIYKDELKRILFLTSLGLIFIGMLCFFGSKVDGVIPGLLSVVFTLLLMGFTLGSIFFTSSAETFHGAWQTVIVVVVIALCLFSGFIVYKNTDCIQGTPSCAGFWVSWSWSDITS